MPGGGYSWLVSVLPHEGGPFPVLYRTFGVPLGSGYRQGFISRPDKIGRFPAVVAVSPSAGIASYVKGVSWQLARKGFAVTAVNPVSRAGGSPGREALAAVGDAIDFVLSEETTSQGRIGLWGFEEGGRYAAAATFKRMEVGAVVVSETPLSGDDDPDFRLLDWAARVTVPLLGLYGREDDRIPTELVDEAQAASPNGQWIVYEGVGHGFLDEDGDGYHRGAAHDAVARAAQLFAAALPQAQLAA